jgi:hypothetical protein
LEIEPVVLCGTLARAKITRLDESHGRSYSGQDVIMRQGLVDIDRELGCHCSEVRVRQIAELPDDVRRRVLVEGRLQAKPDNFTSD